jgi:hypothetical protein
MMIIHGILASGLNVPCQAFEQAGLEKIKNVDEN